MDRLTALLRALAVMLPLFGFGNSAHAISDPIEPLNRAAFLFNNFLLDYVVDPVGSLAQAYVTPGIRQAAGNMYLNISEPEFIVTNLLQGNFGDSFISLERVAVNSTIGIAGIFDVATGMGLVARQTELSEAVCAMGVPAGPYLVIPIVGAANVNSTAVFSTLFVGHLYVLNLISPWLLVADLVIDTTVAAALLRHSADPINTDVTDPYLVQRLEYYQYIETACTVPTGATPPPW